MGKLTQITDDGFPGFRSVDYIGQLVIGVEPQRRFWFHSAIANALEYSTLDRYESESSPDRLVGVVVSHNDVLVFGERTTEQWSNSPTETRSFQRNDGMTIERGCANEHTICRLDNTVYFLADNMTVCKIEGGSTPVPVSTRAMEREFANADPTKAFAFIWEDGGHAVYYITVGGKTWGWDVTQREWHRRDSEGLDRWRFATMFKWNGDWYAGDYSTGMVYRLDWNYALEGCDPLDCRRITGYVHDSGNKIIVRGVRVEVDSGGEPSTCAELPPDPPDPPEQPAVLLVTGTEKTTGSPVFATAEVGPAPVFVGIEQSTGADVPQGTPAYYGDTFCVVQQDQVRYTENILGAWLTGTVDSASPLLRLIGGPGGWVANESNVVPTASGYVCGSTTPSAFTLASFTGNYSNGIEDASTELNQAKIIFYQGGYYFRNGIARGLFRANTPTGTYTAAWDQVKIAAAGQDPNGACIIEFPDLCFVGGEWYAVIEWHFNEPSRRRQVVRSINGIDDWSDLEILVDTPVSGPHAPAQIVPCDGELIVYAVGGGVWTSANGWEAWVDNGITGTPGGPRKIAAANGYVFCIDDTDQCVVSPDKGPTWGAPITMPIGNATGIVASTQP